MKKLLIVLILISPNCLAQDSVKMMIPKHKVEEVKKLLKEDTIREKKKFIKEFKISVGVGGTYGMIHKEFDFGPSINIGWEFTF